MAYVKLVHAGHFSCLVRHHVLTMFERSDIMSDTVSHIQPAHMGHFQFHVRHVPCGPHIWRTLAMAVTPTSCMLRLIKESFQEKHAESLANLVPGIYKYSMGLYTTTVP